MKDQLLEAHSSFLAQPACPSSYQVVPQYGVDPVPRLCAHEVLTHPGTELSCIQSRQTLAVPAGEQAPSGCLCISKSTKIIRVTMASGTDKTAAC